MNQTKIKELIKSQVKANEAKRIYPAYTTLNALTREAAEQFPDYDSKKFKDILREMLKKKLIHAGNTINDVWITHKKDNYYANT